MTNKPFQLSRGCSIAVVLSGALIFLIGICVFRLSQLPNDLGIGLGRGSRIANILVSAEADHHQRLVIFDNGDAGLEFPDKSGIFGRAQEITLTAEEWQAFNVTYQEWCVKPLQRTDQAGGQVYTMGLSCGTTFGQSIEVSETQVPPILLHLFRRAVTKQP